MVNTYEMQLTAMHKGRAMQLSSPITGLKVGSSKDLKMTSTKENTKSSIPSNITTNATMGARTSFRLSKARRVEEHHEDSTLQPTVRKPKSSKSHIGKPMYLLKQP